MIFYIDTYNYGWKYAHMTWELTHVLSELYKCISTVIVNLCYTNIYYIYMYMTIKTVIFYVFKENRGGVTVNICKFMKATWAHFVNVLSQTPPQAGTVVSLGPAHTQDSGVSEVLHRRQQVRHFTPSAPSSPSKNLKLER